MGRCRIATVADRIVPDEFIRGDRPLVRPIIELLAAGYLSMSPTPALQFARRLEWTHNLAIYRYFQW